MPDDINEDEQLNAFDGVLAELDRAGELPNLVHAANTAGSLAYPRGRYNMVRCGIAIYGGDPMNVDPAGLGLEPALELSSYVAAVKLARAGDSAGYGRRFVAERLRPIEAKVAARAERRPA